MTSATIDTADRTTRPHPFDLTAIPPLCRAVGLRVLGGRSFEVSVHLIGDREMRQLNREHRAVDKTTDVLSFPVEEDLRPQLANHDWQPAELSLGDILISPPMCLKQAADWGWTPAERLAQLVVHGFLHLIGYDHMEPDELQEMESLEEVIFAELETNGFIAPLVKS